MLSEFVSIKESPGKKVISIYPGMLPLICFAIVGALIISCFSDLFLPPSYNHVSEVSDSHPPALMLIVAVISVSVLGFMTWAWIVNIMPETITVSNGLLLIESKVISNLISKMLTSMQDTQFRS